LKYSKQNFVVTVLERYKWPEDMMTLKWNLRKLGVIIDNKNLGSLNCLETVGCMNTNKYTITKFLQTHSIK
jgi:hypothetical protein